MTWLKLMLVVLLAMTLVGCELAGGIFKAGAFVGALAVILLVAAVAFLVMKFKR